MTIDLTDALTERILLKVITGINNFNVDKVSQIASAAELGRATYIDIAANDYLVDIVRQQTQIPICISSIDPSNLYKCIRNGAQIVEIGNYDSFYRQGFNFSIDRILLIAKQIKDYFPEITLSVTIPHHLSIKKQIYLAQRLQEINVDFLQTEGISSHREYELKTDKISTPINKIASTLSTTYAISKAVPLPIITASGISHMTSLIAIKYGASGIGIGNAIQQLNGIQDMTNFIKIIKRKLTHDSIQEIDYKLSTICSSVISPKKELLLNH